jgi:hypothetical protein
VAICLHNCLAMRPRDEKSKSTPPRKRDEVIPDDKSPTPELDDILTLLDSTSKRLDRIQEQLSRSRALWWRKPK